VKDVAQDEAQDVPQDVAQDFAFEGRAACALLATPPPPPPLSLLSWRYAEMGAQLGSSVAFGSGWDQAGSKRFQGCRAKRLYVNF